MNAAEIIQEIERLPEEEKGKSLILCAIFRMRRRLKRWKKPSIPKSWRSSIRLRTCLKARHLMLEIRATTRFKKEVKKAARQQKDMQKLSDAIDLLQAEEALPEHNRDHALTGN